MSRVLKARLWLAAAMFAVLAGGTLLPLQRARADDASPCRALIDRVGTAVAASVAQDGTDGCIFRDMKLVLSRAQSLHVDTLTVHRLDLGAPLTAGPPPNLRLEARGASMRSTVNPIIAYITSVTSHPFDLVLDYRTDPATGSLHVAEASMSGASFGSLSLALDLAGVDLGRLPGGVAGATTDGRLASLTLRFANKGMFEGFVVPWLAGVLLQGTEDPWARVSALKAQATVLVAGALGRAQVAPSSIAAISHFIADLPHPGGVLLIEGRFSPPLTESDLDATLAGAPPAMTGDRRLTASYP